MCADYTARNRHISILVPGQNGATGDMFKDAPLMNTNRLIEAQTPMEMSKIDFGQENCVKLLDHAITQSHEYPGTKAILYGVSQGTATITKMLSKMSHREQDAKFAGIILQSILGSPESAIMHSAELEFAPVAYLPFARLWLPFMVRNTMFRAYNPKQPNTIENIKKISPNLPVLMMHNDKDMQLPIYSARSAYKSLVESGHKNAYFIEVSGKAPYHFDILDPACDPEHKEHISAIQAIYKKHDLPHDQQLLPEAAVDLSKYQIDPKALSDIDPKRRLRNYIDTASIAASIGIIANSAVQ